MRKMRALSCLLLPVAITTAPAFSLPGARDREALCLEEEQDYYEKWLREDVVYIISDDEREVFRRD